MVVLMGLRRAIMSIGPIIAAMYTVLVLITIHIGRGRTGFTDIGTGRL